MTKLPVHPHQGKPLPLRLVLARPRLLLSLVLGLCTFVGLPASVSALGVTRAVIAWNTGAIVYLVLALKMMFWSSHERMRSRALQHDEGNAVVLLLVIAAAIACIVAIVAELAVVKDLHGSERYAHILLAALTIATSWAFTQTMFALHYAHDYYLAPCAAGTAAWTSPASRRRTTATSCTFASVIGTSGQTADVSFTSRLACAAPASSIACWPSSSTPRCWRC